MELLRKLFAVLVAVAAVDGSSAAGSGVTIYRDSWGVPHIYADTAESAAWGHGYAQAEDRLDDVLAAWLVGIGQSASVFGSERLEQDRVARIARHQQISSERYPELSADARRLIEAFLDGVTAYMDEHPERVPSWGFRPQPYHVVALYRAFAWAWPWGQARGDLERTGSHAGGDRGSNQWVVGPSRTADGSAIALIDPHLSWAPENRFYEAHVHGGELSFYGFSIPGTPIMAVGHTDVFSLALTTGGPDCADVYEEMLDPEDPTRYRYDGEWLRVEVERVAIEVGGPDGSRTETFEVERTRHGPILARSGDRAYAIRTAYDREIGIVEQWLGMVRARNLGEFINAMRANQSLPQNVMYADVYGNTFFVRAGRVPRRPEGYRWDRPVPGWTSGTQWRGVHRFSELVQILNPPSGFMQNCNNSPDVMMPASPLTAERYLPHIYNSRPQRWNSRGRRALELLESMPRLTVEDALGIAVDSYVEQAPRWQEALARAWTVRSKPEALRGAVELLLEWDGRMDVSSRAAALYRMWMRATREDGSGVPRDVVERGDEVSPAAAATLLESLRQAAEATRSRLGRIDVPWGEIHRAARDGASWPVAGCRADGISTLRSVRSSDTGDAGGFRVDGGQICTAVVVLSENGVRSFSATPFGQSNRKESPHYTDQGRRLFAQSRLKPTWYDRRELLEHLESQRTFRVQASDDE